MTDLHPVPTPRDVRAEIPEVTEEMSARLRAALVPAPVLDVPARQDAPTSSTTEPERFTARVHVATDPTSAPVYVGGVVSWREYSSRLDLYGIVDGQRERLVSFAPHAWVWVERVTDNTEGIDA